MFDSDLDGTWIECAIHGKLNEGVKGLVIGDAAAETWLGFCATCEDDLLESLLHRRVLKLENRAGSGEMSTRAVLPMRLEKKVKAGDDAA
jgi:hypothetical protein